MDMKTPYINKKLDKTLEGILAEARSDINNGKFEEAKKMADYIETLGYEMTSCAIRQEIHKAQKMFGKGLFNE